MFDLLLLMCHLCLISKTNHCGYSLFRRLWASPQDDTTVHSPEDKNPSNEMELLVREECTDGADAEVHPSDSEVDMSSSKGQNLVLINFMYVE